MINNSKTKKETYRALFIPPPYTKANPEYTLFFKLFSKQFPWYWNGEFV